MTGAVRPTRAKFPGPRRLQFLRRAGTAVDGVVKVGSGQSLMAFLNSRSGWMSMTQAKRSRSGDEPGHLLIQTDQIIMASAPDGDVQVASTPLGLTVDERIVELVLMGGHVVRGYLPAAAGQRISDCIAASGKFMGVTLARLFPERKDVGDVAIATAALTMVRDLRGSAPEPKPEPEQ